MQRLLIANRGEIALRIARTAHEMDIETVTIFVPEEQAQHRRGARDAFDLRAALTGRGAAAYLDIEDVMRIARENDCDALHPGYGFLSENPDLARACADAGVLFVGPPAQALECLGHKARARALAERAGVPIVEGIDAVESPAAVRRFQERLARSGGSCAVVLKAAAGGGGRGLRIVRDPSEIDAAYARCRSEALRSFGSEALLAERYVEDARHIEVQIVADATGQVGHVWERDCTLQRRHQKIVERAPAPALEAALREALLDAACAVMREVDYLGLATVEFLLDAQGAFYFLEVNPRLQVEHTVTEAITGLDLVECQLRLAEGAPLQELGLLPPPAPRGHAIELRVLAETLTPTGDARPSSETITRFDLANGPGVRVDTDMRSGCTPQPAYDSLLAKMIVSHPDPDASRCARRARRALDESLIEGPATNLDLLAVLLARPEFEQGAYTTGFLQARIAELAPASAARRAARATQPSPGAGTAASPAPAASTDEARSSYEASATAPAASPPDLPTGSWAVLAPLLGSVLEVVARPGARVAKGDPLFVLESMKMEHLVRAEGAALVESIFAAAGDVVVEHQRLAHLRPVDEAPDEAGDPVDAAAHDLDRIRPDLAELHARLALLEDTARPDAVERRRSRGQRTARENLEAVCDAGSFVEYGALAVAAMRKLRPLAELERKTPADAIVTGFGSINADLFGADAARCAFLIVDATVLAGTQGFYHHKKIDRILELAEAHATPVVFFPEGGGGRPNDTDVGDVFVAGLNITSFQNFARLSGKVPRISVVAGFCFAGSAAFAGCSDVIIATRNTSLGMGGPAMIEGGGLGVHAPEDVGPISVLEPKGVVDLVVEDEIEAAAAARRVLAYFQGPLPDWQVADQRALRQAIPENRRRVYDIRSVIDTLCDANSVIELRRAYGVGMITALVRIEGRPMGLIANDPSHLGGAIDDEAAQKAARFLQLCDAFGLPILSLCDTPGFMVGPEIEARGQVRKVSRLFVTGASLAVPIFCVILRKGYGLGAQAMAGGSFAAPFYIAAWPTGEIGGMGLEGAVRLGFKKRLEEIEDEVEREALFQKLVGVMYDKGKAIHAASQLEFDAVLDPADTRTALTRALHAAGPIGRGTGRFIDTW